jgi:hypothetical protein
MAPDTRHRWHRLDPVPALDHEHWINEVIGRKPVLAPQPAREFVAPHPAHAPPRKPAVYPHRFNLLKEIEFFSVPAGNSGPL